MFANSLIIVSLALAASVQAGLYISTPTELKQCEEATFIISGATGSVWPFVVDSKTPCDEPLLELIDATGDLKWTPNLEVGKTVMLAVEDEAGEEAFSGQLTIQPGNSSSCLNKPSSASSASATYPSPTQSSAADTPKNVANSSQQDANANANQTGGAIPVRVVFSGVTVLTALSALSLAL